MSEEYIICNECNGKGAVYSDRHAIYYCSKCKGVGKLNWLENIFGKKYPLTEDEHIIFDINMKICRAEKELKK